MSEPFDLDAALADASPEPFRFRWAAEFHEMPALIAMPVEQQAVVIAAAQELDPGNALAVVSLMKQLIGDELLAHLNAAKPMSALGMVHLLQAWMVHQGLGKFSASEPSSESTAPL